MDEVQGRDRIIPLTYEDLDSESKELLEVELKPGEAPLRGEELRFMAEPKDWLRRKGSDVQAGRADYTHFYHEYDTKNNPVMRLLGARSREFNDTIDELVEWWDYEHRFKIYLPAETAGLSGEHLLRDIPFREKGNEKRDLRPVARRIWRNDISG